MPTQAFFNLPKEKQDRILKMAKLEFCQYPFNEVSINKIIQHADISRGSFYIYFENKKDLFMYIMQEYNCEMIHFINESIKDSERSIFDYLFAVFDYLTCGIKDEEQKQIYINSLLNLDTRTANQLISLTDGEFAFLKSDFLETDFVSIEQLRFQNEKELKNILEILRSVLFNQLITVFADNVEVSKARGELVSKIELLKNGIVK